MNQLLTVEVTFAVDVSVRTVPEIVRVVSETGGVRVSVVAGWEKMLLGVTWTMGLYVTYNGHCCHSARYYGRLVDRTDWCWYRETLASRRDNGSRCVTLENCWLSHSWSSPLLVVFLLIA
jgi:hypothetical protein